RACHEQASEHQPWANTHWSSSFRGRERPGCGLPGPAEGLARRRGSYTFSTLPPRPRVQTSFHKGRLTRTTPGSAWARSVRATERLRARGQESDQVGDLLVAERGEVP